MELNNQIISVENKDSEDEINLKELFEKYSYQWKWFLISLIFSLLLAYFYLQTTTNKYLVSSTIFINDEESGGLSNELMAFEDLGMLGNSSKTSIINAQGELKSLSLVEAVIKELRFNIRYFREDKFKVQEIYQDKVPIKINIFAHDSILHDLDTTLTITIKSKTKYVIAGDDEDIEKEVKFGENVETHFGNINVTPLNSNDLDIDETIIIEFSKVSKIANKYRKKLDIEPESKNSSLLVIKLEDEVRMKGKDFLNTLVLQYNKNAIAYKTLITENTDKFINDRINDISIDLENIDKGVEDFKTENKLTDIEYEAGLVLTSNSELQKTINDLSSQINLVDFVIDHLKRNKDKLIPANLGIRDQTTSDNTVMYNRLILERNRIIKGSSKLNPTVVNLEEQIEILRKSIEQSLENLRSSLNFSLKEAKNQEYRLSKRRDIAPKQEREFQDIKRKQQIIESLYLYLLQKREENAITMGLPVPNAKIIDLANGSKTPVSPVPMIIYLFMAVIGMGVPFLIISVLSLMDNKIHNSQDIEAVLKSPLIGEIPKTKIKDKLVPFRNSNTGIAEAFRLLRTNVNFMLSGAKEGSKLIFLTSTISGEGKTFIAINLAASLSLINKKVLLIGADIRKPKFHAYLNVDPKMGLTNYLADPNLEISDIIHTDDEAQIDIIFSGEIPPNPSELILNGKIEDVMEYGRSHYDYIIVDTSPVSMVTDTLLLGNHADLFIYVVRAEYLDKRLLRVPQSLYENKRLPNMSVLINATDYEGKGHSYGYGYSYGYGENSKQSWWKRKLSWISSSS